MKRLTAFLLLMLLVVALTATAQAGDPLRRDMIPGIAVDSEVVSRGDLICGPDELTTGESTTWSTQYQPEQGEQLVWYACAERNAEGVWMANAVGNGSSFTWTPISPCEGMLFLCLLQQTDDGQVMSYLEWMPITVTGTDPVAEKVQQLAAQCVAAAGSDEYEKSLWLHDWLTHNADYDYTYTYYGPEGVLLYGTGVCDSFSKAYGLLLTEVGVTSERAVSKKQNHAWNYVRINGEWYETDVTWDDDEIHSYLNLSSRIMDADHYGEEVLHNCTSLDDNYLVRNGVGDVIADHLLTHLTQEDGWTSKLFTEANTWCYSCFEAAGYSDDMLNDIANFMGRLDVAGWVMDGMTMTLEDGTQYRVSAVMTDDGLLVERTVKVDCNGVHYLNGDVCTGCGESFTVGERDVLNLPAELTSVGAEAFSGTAAQCVVVPDSCTTLDTGAFSDCSGLEIIFLPEGLSDMVEALAETGVTVAVRSAQ